MFRKRMNKIIKAIIEDRRNYYERMDKIGYKQKWIFAKLFGVSPSRLFRDELGVYLADTQQRPIKCDNCKSKGG